ncbi:MAG: 3-oxoacyl-[acyl-carrier protein] reductase, partial [Alphaproteobacteria bacterium]|nr:3-oxoacyl-[acyl-carrier protein] reductase [Alphaproteobacteria bacterium]
MQLKDKVAVVTGGSSGIGAATVRMLADEGASVVICYNKGEERARALLAQLPKADHKPGHRIQHLTLEDSASVRRAADEIGSAHGRADILINSAGFTRPIPHAQLDALDDALLDSIL